MSIQLQIASDLHLECMTNIEYEKIIKPTAPILVLAGDIGNLYNLNQLKDFIKWCCEQFVAVLYVPGNHEYYRQFNTPTLPFYKLNFQLKDLEKQFKNLYILQRKLLEINNIYFAGCTLWSNFKQSPLPKYIVRIKGFNKYIYNNEHYKDLKFIKQVISKSQKEKKKLIIITHHVPLYLTSCNHAKDNFNSLYFTNLEFLLEKKKIDTWICGHIHSNFDFIHKNGTRVISNQKGKIKDKITDYSPNCTISF